VLLSAQSSADGVEISVRDTGEGIAAADLPFVFDRFWRGDRARTHGTGSGLGLSIAAQLVKAHGGKITVSSEVGQGTTFVLVLPRATPDATT
jgi:two-component system sensor histidine kinase ResE